MDQGVNHTPTYQEAKDFFLHLGIRNFSLSTGQACGWRCRAKLAVRGTKEEPLIGLFQAGSHSLTDIPHCKVHHPLINQAANLMRKWIKEKGIEPYNEKSGKGLLRYLQFAIDRENQSVQLAFVLNLSEEEFKERLGLFQSIQNLWEEHPGLWHSFWLNFNQRHDNVIFGKDWKHLFGKEWLFDRFCGRQVCFHPASFAQANPEMFEKLLIQLLSYVPHGTNGIEFYAGGGAIGLVAIEKYKSLVCNEIVPLAETCFYESSKLLPEPLKNKITFILGPAEKQTNLLNQDVDFVIVDPPRKGIDEVLLQRLCKNTNVKRLIYVSCGWKSFQKDCKQLLNHHWKLTHAESFLFFPGSDHLEVLAIFDK